MKETEKLQQNLKLIEKHERLFSQLVQAVKEKEVSQEEAEIELQKIRKDLVIALELSINTTDEKNIQVIYENRLFSHLTDQLYRTFGFTKAMDKHDVIIQKYNEKIGDQVLIFKRDDVEQTIYNLNKISLTKALCDDMGLTTESEHIISNLINKYFKPQNNM